MGNEDAESRTDRRVTIPLGIELTHPIFGHIQVKARDMSSTGLYIYIDEKLPITIGDIVMVKVLGLGDDMDAPAPIVTMQVMRKDRDGVGLSIKKESAEDQIGKAYSEISDSVFRLEQAAIIINQSRQLLLVKQEGYWFFPWRYLVNNEQWDACLLSLIQSDTGIQSVNIEGVLAVDNCSPSDMPGFMQYNIFFICMALDTSQGIRLSKQYSDFCWVDESMDLEGLEVKYPQVLDLIRKALNKERFYAA